MVQWAKSKAYNKRRLGGPQITNNQSYDIFGHELCFSKEIQMKMFKL